MIADVTDKAIIQLLLLADLLQLPQDKVVFLVEGKMRMPAQLIWYITPALSYDKRFLPVTVKGLNFAVEHNGAVFLAGVVIDYNEKLLKDGNLYAPTTTEQGKPVWPKGFVFENQQQQHRLT